LILFVGAQRHYLMMSYVPLVRPLRYRVLSSIGEKCCGVNFDVDGPLNLTS
jgi:hypothetical protein